MEREVAERLNDLNAGFYHNEAASFSETRQSPWPGWGRCLASVPVRPHLRVLDVACGNLRFARFLAGERPGEEVSYHAVDSTPELAGGWEAPAGWQLSFERRDIVRDLLDGALAQPEGEGYDLVACFGFLHHVPTAAARAELVSRLATSLAPGGVCCISLWRFASDAALARRAKRTTGEALSELGLRPRDLDEGDYLLGWEGRPHVWRYCHSFGEAEVDGLVAAAREGAAPVDRFLADGRGGRLNAYVVVRRP